MPHNNLYIDAFPIICQGLFAKHWYHGGMTRFTLSHEQWQQFEPLLPSQTPKMGRPNHDHRQMVEGML